jgi:hypothetical protein
MWFPVSVGLPISLLGLAAQVPLEPPPAGPSVDMVAGYGVKDFSFKEGPNIFSPIDLVQLPRPGAGSANPGGDLFIVPVSKYSSKDKKFVSAVTGLGDRALTASVHVQESQVHLHRAH